MQKERRGHWSLKILLMRENAGNRLPLNSVHAWIISIQFYIYSIAIFFMVKTLCMISYTDIWFDLIWLDKVLTSTGFSMLLFCISKRSLFTPKNGKGEIKKFHSNFDTTPTFSNVVLVKENRWLHLKNKKSGLNVLLLFILSLMFLIYCDSLIHINYGNFQTLRTSWWYLVTGQNKAGLSAHTVLMGSFVLDLFCLWGYCLA